MENKEPKVKSKEEVNLQEAKRKRVEFIDFCVLGAMGVISSIGMSVVSFREGSVTGLIGWLSTGALVVLLLISIKTLGNTTRLAASTLKSNSKLIGMVTKSLELVEVYRDKRDELIVTIKELRASKLDKTNDKS